MSGFEIAGLVVGVLPLLIEALKAGRKVKRSIDQAVKVNIYLNRYALELRLHLLELKDIVLKVAKEAGVSALSEASLRSKQGRILLRTNEDALSASLGLENSEIFMLVLEEEQRLCHHLVLLLKDLLPEQKVLRSYYSSSVWEHPKRRIKFLHRRSDIEEILENLRKTTCHLSQLAKKPGDEIYATGSSTASQHSPRQIKAELTALEKIQKASAHLLIALRNTIPDTCPSHSRHALRFFLEPHTARERFCREHNPSFLLEILAQSRNVNDSVHHKDRIVVRQCTEDLKNPIEEPAKKRRPVVRFAPVPKSLPTPSPTPSPPYPQAETVKTLCKSLSQLSCNKLTIHVSEVGVLQCTRSYLDTKPAQSRDLISLAEILERVNQDKCLERTWTRQQRINLAFVLASNLLQLNCANWAPECLDADTIRFYVEPEPGFDAPPFDPSQPFLENTCTAGGPKDSSPYFARQWSLDLAILLLELWTGTSFRSWTRTRVIRDVFVCHATRREAAERWFDATNSDMLLPYRTAARSCLEFSGMSTYRWEAREFRERFLQGVVGPLQDFTKAGRETR